MKNIEQRITTLKELRKQLVSGPKDRKIELGSYLMLLDYHVNLLDELNVLAEAIKNGDKNIVEDWIQVRINADESKEVYTSQSENPQQPVDRTVKTRRY